MGSRRAWAPRVHLGQGLIGLGEVPMAWGRLRREREGGNVARRDIAPDAG